MFQNRINSFVVPGISLQPIPNPAAPATSNTPSPPTPPLPVQLVDIYQAARQRAIEEHELDKLFNPEFYDDYQI